MNLKKMTLKINGADRMFICNPEKDTLADVIRASKVISKFYTGRSSLYKDEAGECYVLALSKSKHTTEEFNRICNVLSEYGVMQKSSQANEAYFTEHHNCIVANNAIEALLS